MIRLLFLLVVSFFFVETNAQEKSSNTSKEKTFKSGVGVVDMKKILQDSTAYQALVDQFEEKRRKHRNKFTKIEDVIRDEESKLSKQKGVLSKEDFDSTMLSMTCFIFIGTNNSKDATINIAKKAKMIHNLNGLAKLISQNKIFLSFGLLYI